LDELGASIQSRRQSFQPLVVRPMGRDSVNRGGKAAGERPARRFDKVSVVVKEGRTRWRWKWTLVENIQREAERDRGGTGM